MTTAELDAGITRLWARRHKAIQRCSLDLARTYEARVDALLDQRAALTRGNL